MSLFDQLVTQALSSHEDLVPLRPVVEKEFLHHDILREMADNAFLTGLTFIGGTCLRMCYGSPRLSEDLDFTGDFDEPELPEHLVRLGAVLEKSLEQKYNLPVTVSEPRRVEGLVRTWKIRITTQPQRPDLPAQRIHIDLQALPAHDPQPMVLKNTYRVEMGTSGLILMASSLEEILVDKCIALALRENRIKNRDLWDIGWLVQQNIQPPGDLLAQKLADRNVSAASFYQKIQYRLSDMTNGQNDFVREMERFLPPGRQLTTAKDPRYWDYLTRTIRTLTADLVPRPRPHDYP